MHEMQLAKNIVQLLESQVKDPEVGKVKFVHLEVGELRYIVPEIMETGFNCVPKSEKLKDAGMKIEVKPVRVRCMECKEEFNVSDNEYDCKKCNSKKTEMISGNQFLIKGIEW